uniref:Putative ovule protein n=1 Tax=Solanum chacoense TaxID=4108 RepID=A0A0V0I3D0_SOLCH
MKMIIPVQEQKNPKKFQKVSIFFGGFLKLCKVFNLGFSKGRKSKLKAHKMKKMVMKKELCVITPISGFFIFVFSLFMQLHDCFVTFTIWVSLKMLKFCFFCLFVL